MSNETLGFLAGCIIIGLTTIVVTMIAGGVSWHGWPHEWDTMLVGVLAVLSAFFTIRMMNEQITQVDRNRRRDVERQSFAARAVLPVALSYLSDYARNCVDQLLPALARNNTDLQDHVFDFRPIPSDVIPTVQDCIRFANSGKRRELADLLRELQIQHGRLVDFAARRTFRLHFNVVEHTLDAIELFGRCSALFAYARREPDAPLQALVGLGVICGVSPGMHSDLDARIAAAEDPYRTALNSYRTEAA